MQIKLDGGDIQKLIKFMIVLMLLIGLGYWNCFELCFYVIIVKWNFVVNVVNGVGGLMGIGDGKISGISYGFQVEIWW